MKKYREAQRLLSGKYRRGMKLEDVLDKALEVFLDKKSPLRRRKSREKRERKNEIRTSKPAKSLSRHILQKISDMVFKFVGNIICIKPGMTLESNTTISLSGHL